MADEKAPPPKMVKATLKKNHTHQGIQYTVEKDKEPPEIEVTEKQAAWLKERGIV